MTEEWYSYGKFRFTRDQVMWAICNLPELKGGNWPANPEGSSYTELPSIKKKVGGEAGFVKACEIAAEIESRLKKTGIDGKLLVAELRGGWRTPAFEDLQPESQMALNYICLWDFRKRPPYYQWKKSRRYYQKVTKSTEI